ncbi:protein C19orf12 homolog [Sparus aurata]|uniref:Chromosome 19 open reading frame 12 n=1 Tax=Sparus aurata TaxID=8175 RepID=A0A671X871_SPAAU|nr:protein C19orf12 homolog [Sparus aurata]XP_030271317.1 protein C19orf12 homolog [Sparus aurata]
MDQRVNDVIHLCREIANQPEFKNTWKEVVTGSSITAAGAAAGGLLLGPLGFPVGGAAGGLLSWLMTRGKFKSLPQILMELPQAEKQKLYDNVVAVLDNLTWKNAAQLDEVVMGNADLRERVTDVLQNYIKKNV